MKIKFLILLLLTSYLATSQNINSTSITVEVKNEKGDKINDAYLLGFNDSLLFGVTQNGVATFNVMDLPPNITISHISYETEYLNFKNFTKEDTSLYFTVVLQERINEIPQVSIDEILSDLAYSRARDNVADYELYEDNILLLLKAGKHSTLRLIDQNSATIFSLTIPKRAKGLYRDCFNNLHVIYSDSMHQIKFNGDSYSLTKGYSIQEYESTLFKCSASNSASFILGFVGVYEQEIFYFYKHMDSSNYQFLRNSVDVRNKYIASCRQLTNNHIKISGNAAAPGSIGDSLVLNNYRLDRSVDRAMAYFKHVESSPLYSPIFTFNGSYLMFDHINDSLFLFDHNGFLIEQLEIEYHKNEAWQKRLYADYLNGEIYAEFKKRGKKYISKIDLSDGSLAQKQFYFRHAFPEKVQIRNNKIYYLYRESHKPGLPQQLFTYTLN